MNSTENGVAIRQNTGMAAIVRSMDDLTKLGETIAKSGVCGADLTAATGAVVAMTCITDGITPIEFNRKYHIIGGKPSMKANVMLGTLITSGGKYKIKETTGEVCEIEFTFGENTVTVRHTLKEFIENGVALEKSGQLRASWKRFPQSMLFARTTSRGVSMVAPHIPSGMYTPEEIEDIISETPVRPVELTPEQVAERQKRGVGTETSSVVEPEVVPNEPKKPGTRKTAKAEPKQTTEDAQVIPTVQQQSDTPDAAVSSSPSTSTALDPSIIPAGSLAGKKWEWQESATLAFALGSSKIPEECKVYIRELCATRGWEIATGEDGKVTILEAPANG